MTKEKKRAQSEKIRSAISPDEKEALDLSISNNFFRWDIYSKSRTVLCYIPYKSEIDTRVIIRHSLESRKTVGVPKIDPARARMRFFAIRDLDRSLHRGSYGILEPNDGCREILYDTVDLVIAPGLAFTRSGDRLGYGGGYYDRFLASHPGIPCCALVYDRLILESLPVKKTDVQVDYLITETGVLTTLNKRRSGGGNG